MFALLRNDRSGAYVNNHRGRGDHRSYACVRQKYTAKLNKNYILFSGRPMVAPTAMVIYIRTYLVIARELTTAAIS